MEELLGHTSKTPPHSCLKCGYKFDEATGESAIHPGAISICIKCAHVAKFDEQLRVVELSPSEQRDALADPTVRKYIRAIKQLQTRKN